MHNMRYQIPTILGWSVGDMSSNTCMPVNDRVNFRVFSSVVHRLVHCIVGRMKVQYVQNISLVLAGL
jgi:hypothetical protein